VRVDTYMTPKEAAAWWKREARKEWEDRDMRVGGVSGRGMKNTHMNINYIMDYVAPKKTESPGWYRQGRIA
jgi:hypothetical protein